MKTEKAYGCCGKRHQSVGLGLGVNKKKQGKKKKGCPKAAGSEQRDDTAQQKSCSWVPDKGADLFHQASSQASSQKVCGESVNMVREMERGDKSNGFHCP